MNSIRQTLCLIFLCLSFLPNASGSEDFLVLLRGESANSAYQLNQILSGPGVETSGTIKTLLLDADRGMLLSCDTSIFECSLTNSGFVQSESYDMDQLMLIQGSAARKLFNAISSKEKTPNRIFIQLGNSGRYGSDILDCKTGQDGDECQLIRTYCYYPGC
jgi:hypothetical protein